MSDDVGVVERQRIPVMAHRLQDSIVELNWARDEQGGVWRLGGHGVWFWSVWLWFRDLVGLWRAGFLCEVSLLVFLEGTSFCGEGSVEFKKGFRVEMSREEVETRGWA